MTQREKIQKKRKNSLFFIIVLLLAISGLIKIVLTGESDFRSSGPYTAQSDPEKFWFDVGLLVFFLIGSLSVIVSSYVKKRK